MIMKYIFVKILTLFTILGGYLSVLHSVDLAQGFMFFIALIVAGALAVLGEPERQYNHFIKDLVLAFAELIVLGVVGMVLAWIVQYVYQGEYWEEILKLITPIA